MRNVPDPVEIPDKPSFKPSEVCELLGIPAYVLRTWENEFKDLGTAKAAGGARTYVRRDVELAARIRALVFAENLTLAGVRRRLEQEHLISVPPEDDGAAEAGLPDAGPRLSESTRRRLSHVRSELRSLLQQLGSEASGGAATAPESTDSGSSPDGRPRIERRSLHVPGASTPSLPGFDAPARTDRPKGARDGTAPQARLDPAALNFATATAPPAPAGPRRRSRG